MVGCVQCIIEDDLDGELDDVIQQTWFVSIVNLHKNGVIGCKCLVICLNCDLQVGLIKTDETGEGAPIGLADHILNVVVAVGVTRVQRWQLNRQGSISHCVILVINRIVLQSYN